MIIFMAEVAGGLLAYLYRFKIRNAVQDSINEGLKNYGKDKTWTNDVDFMQKVVHILLPPGCVVIPCGHDNLLNKLSYSQLYYL